MGRNDVKDFFLGLFDGNRLERPLPPLTVMAVPGLDPGIGPAIHAFCAAARLGVKARLSVPNAQRFIEAIPLGPDKVVDARQAPDMTKGGARSLNSAFPTPATQRSGVEGDRDQAQDFAAKRRRELIPKECSLRERRATPLPGPGRSASSPGARGARRSC